MKDKHLTTHRKEIFALIEPSWENKTLALDGHPTRKDGLAVEWNAPDHTWDYSGHCTEP